MHDEPGSIEVYRTIVRSASNGAAVDAAVRLGEIGERKVDLVPMQDLMERLPPGMAWARPSVEEAIRRLKPHAPGV